MHIRYDFKIKPDLSQFKTQCLFFLGKEPLCTFHFYLDNYTVLFDINRVENCQDSFKVSFKIAEAVSSSDSSSSKYTFINPLNDARLKEIHFLSDIFNGDLFVAEKSSKEEVFNFISFILTSVRKIQSLSALS